MIGCVAGLVGLLLTFGLLLPPFFLMDGLMQAPSSIKTSQGVREGELIKFSERGVFVKNWCGELALGTFQTGGSTGISPYVWEFGLNRSRQDLPVVAAGLNAMVGKNVKLYYRQNLWSNRFNGCSEYIVESVEEIK